jgi:hypothetical protein
MKGIIPVDQEFLHDPENGVCGDCMRACIATILSVPRHEVPHFLHDDCDAVEFGLRVQRYLKSFGLFLMDVGAFDFGLVMTRETPDVFHLIYGHTERGTYHAVVGKNGQVFHDPHPSKAGLVDGDWTYGLMVKAFS